jgi:hypothetical protein
MYVIRPFRHQGAQELAAALFVKQIGLATSIICALLALIIVLLNWRRLFKPLAVIFLLLAIAGAFLSRVNVYERMFHPLGQPYFVAAKEATVDKDDMVIAVQLNGESRAYPVREMAYHHVVNDTLGHEPIVSTY